MVKNKLDFDDSSFSRNSIRQAMKLWHNLEKLGEHPLTRLEVVDYKRQIMKRPKNLSGYGVSLRNVLFDALKELRPNSEEPDFEEEDWCEYLILTESYINKKNRTVIIDQLRHITSGSMYHRIQNRSLDKLGSILHQWEGERLIESVHDNKGDKKSPFLAPPPLTFNLVDRYPLLQRIKVKLLGSTEFSTVSLHGLPGVGKTTLANTLAYDRDMLKHFQDGILWADIGRRPSLLTTLDRWGKALGISAVELAQLINVKDKARRIKEAIGLQHVLLVIDDAWKLEDALTFQVGGPNCAYLLTTRFPIIARDFAEEGTINVKELSLAGGFALFSRLAPKVTELAPEASNNLVTKVKGLPLAIVLLAKILRNESEKGWNALQSSILELTNIQPRYELSQLQHPINPHPSLESEEKISLSTLIDISVKALDESTKKTLFTFSVYAPKPHTFSQASALGISNTTVRNLGRLIDFGLIEKYASNRYTIHQTISDYLRTKISAEEKHILVKSHAEYYLEYAKKHGEQWQLIETEFPQIREAWQAINQLNHVHLILNYSKQLKAFQQKRGLWMERIDWCFQGIIAAKDLNKPIEEGDLLNAVGWSFKSIGKYEEALDYLSQALLLRCEIEDKRGEAETLNNIGAVHENLGDFQISLDYLKRAVSLWETLEKCEKDLASTLNNIGVTYYSLSQFNEAIEYYTKAAQIHRRLDNASSEGLTYGNMAAAYRLLGQLDKSLEYRQWGLQIAQERGETSRIASHLNGLGATYRDLGEFEKALKYYLESLLVSRQLKTSNKEALALHNIGVLYNDLKTFERALNYLEEALKIRREIRQRNGEAYTLSAIGNVYGNLGMIDKGQYFIDQSLNIWCDIGNRYGESLGQLNLGNIFLKGLDYDIALSAFNEAYDLANDINAEEVIALSLFGIGQSLAKQDHLEKARNYGAKSLEILKPTNSRKVTEVAKWLEELS